MNVVYVLQAGYVHSKSNGKKQFVSEAQLQQLYGVEKNTCLNFMRRGVKMRLSHNTQYVGLKPCYLGNYRMPAIKRIETSLVSDNIMSRKRYTPHCGSKQCRTIPRAFFNNTQFECPACGWKSNYSADFISHYKIKWSIE